MSLVHSIVPLLAVLVSLAALPGIILARGRPNLRETVTFAAAGLKLILVASLLPYLLNGQEVACDLVRVLPGAPLAFKVDAFGLLFALVSSSLWIVTSAYSIGYMRGLDEHSQTRYYCFFAVALSATIGVAFSANLFTLYLFYEMLSLATYPLVTHHQDAEARTSGRKYLFYIMGTSIGLALPAMIIAYQQAGTLAFSPAGFLAGKVSPLMAGVLLFMFIFGFAKAGMMPVHSWLPAAMVAPTPVSALLHAVAVVKVGVFCILRVITGVFGVGLLKSLDLGLAVAWVAAFTIIVASLIALSQDGLKRRLAFSTIGQLSYIVLGLALLSPKGMIGGSLHIAMHAFGKITLFMCAGAIFVATGKKNISEMTGIGKRMPWTMAAFLVGSLSVIGLPPAGGFISKWYLVLGCLQAGSIGLLVVLLVSSLLNAAYFLPIVYRAYFKPPSEAAWLEGRHEGPAAAWVPPLITAACSLILFFYPQPFLRLAQMAVAGLGGGQ
ncbi:MAG: monovalent cation/H+ antiporter subunit D family protein [Desulfarculaceae bacterium]|nr:monovalent cation/H+ antiporter subunit D family protein [Desulfarculaceae bacterium]MCF8072990.1 monovalent cation/H+ antiporter subunit D family protein [Desulfarculaceae bacterium]MCF8100714.1 monovalent cation/H+ antiporter subunit D family protein [Desulfarculaceae bacterium]MCF8115452.1 monovalent cation/H+ antiporter subunit D family protein [Desulfarculaceae bacterium]